MAVLATYAGFIARPAGPQSFVHSDGGDGDCVRASFLSARNGKNPFVNKL